MAVDTWLTAAGDVFGLIAIVVAVWAVFDARRERSKREKAVLAARSVIERTYGLLIGISPPSCPSAKSTKLRLTTVSKPSIRHALSSIIYDTSKKPYERRGCTGLDERWACF